MKLCDRIYVGKQRDQHNPSNASGFGGGGGQMTTPNSNKGKVNEPCHKFNKGKCKFGNSCHYEHHCSYCYKFGHNVLSCHKLTADRDQGFNACKDLKEFEKTNN